MLLLGTGSWSFLVDRPFLKFLGFISYGLYLIQRVGIQARRDPVLALVSTSHSYGTTHGSYVSPVYFGGWG